MPKISAPSICARARSRLTTVPASTASHASSTAILPSAFFFTDTTTATYVRKLRCAASSDGLGRQVAARDLRADEGPGAQRPPFACRARLAGCGGHVDPLRGSVAARMAVGAARMEEDAARLEKQGTGAIAAVGDRRERGNRAQRPRGLGRRLRLQRLRLSRRARSDQQQEDSHGTNCAPSASEVNVQLLLSMLK